MKKINVKELKHTLKLKIDKYKKKIKKTIKKDKFWHEVYKSFLLIMIGVVIGCLFSICNDGVFGSNRRGRMYEFISNYNNVVKNYYEDVDEDKLIESAISGMLRSLDDGFSYYMSEENTEEFNQEMDGKYLGIGITIAQQEDGNVKIFDVADNSPAKNAGIEKDDILIRVNGEDVQGKQTHEISKLIKTEEGAEVKITVLRGEEKKKFKVVVGYIDIISCLGEVKEENGKKIGYLIISNFANNTSEQFKKEVERLESEGIESLIIDVRDNGGGQLQVVTDMLEMYFDKGTVLFKLESKYSKKAYKDKTKESRNYPVVVLTNGNSASASEVLTAAFKNSYPNATIIGETTFGKGTAQEQVGLLTGASYKFSTQKWLTSEDEWIHRKGIKPDIRVENKYEEDEDGVKHLVEDTQLIEAIKKLSE